MKCSNFGQAVSAATRICHQSHSMHVYVRSSALSARHAQILCLEANAPTAVENWLLDPGVQLVS
jgi:hypothetical protein